MSTENSPAMEPALVINRFFKAPRELVFKAWTEAEHLKHWWGPKGFTLDVAQLDLRPGGMFLYSMTSGTGQTMWGKFVYREIAAPERLVFVNSFTDAAGNIIRHPLSETWPLEVLNTYTFTEHEGGTLLTMHGTPLNATDAERSTFDAAREGVKQGFGATMSQLDEYLANLGDHPGKM